MTVPGTWNLESKNGAEKMASNQGRCSNIATSHLESHCSSFGQTRRHALFGESTDPDP